MARQYEEISGEFDFERNVFGRGDDRAIVGVLRNDTIVKGKARDGALETGLSYRFYGYWTSHPKYGDQFAFESFTLAAPVGQRGTIAYLQRVRGIGRERAKAIWAAFGEHCLETLKEQPQAVADAIPGITPEIANAAAQHFKDIAGLEKVTIELTELLGNRGLPRRLIEDVRGRWGNDAPRVIRENPYVLLDGFKGVGFLKADALYKELRLPMDAINRQGYCVWHALHSDTDGHTWLDVSAAVESIRENIGGTEGNPKAAIEWAIGEDLVSLRRVDGRTYLAERSRADSEAAVAQYIHQALVEIKNGGARWPTLEAIKKACPKISEHQLTEVAEALQGYVGILAGRPGTGKTFTVAAIIKAIKGARIAAAAPTGKAAVRMTESLEKAGVVGLKARTIHSTLGVVSADSGWSFNHGPDNPLELDFVFVDESSMIDTPLMASFLAARPAGCHVLFVGDPGQLSPVGHGAPLRDLIAVGLPCGQLTEIQRNSGRIVRACAEIAEKNRFDHSPCVDLAAGENLPWIERAQPEGQIEELKGLLESIRNGGKKDPVWDVQILVAVNEKSPLGRKPLNALLQGFLNPNGEQIAGNPFRVGDKIVNGKNGLFPCEPTNLAGFNEEKNDDDKVYSANGELARVEKVFPKFTVARLWNPDRLIRIPRGGGDGGEDDSGCSWDLGFAITTHKAQGAEFPIVIVMIDSYPGAIRLVTKEHIYTSLSRARELCVGIGRHSIALAACSRSGLWKRKTFLREQIEALRVQGISKAWEEDLLEV